MSARRVVFGVALLAGPSGCGDVPSDATAVRLIITADPADELDGVRAVISSPDGEVGRVDLLPERPLYQEERATLLLPAELDRVTVTVVAFGLAGGEERARDVGSASLQAGQAREVPLDLRIRCGDGWPLSAEGCDDGNIDPADGCDEACEVEPGFDCQGAPSVCVPICGDGEVVGTETCDDGRHCEDETSCQGPADCEGVGDESCLPRGGDGCGASCGVEDADCGDGELDDGEQCDEGDESSYEPNACRPDCSLPRCGDGIHDDERNEDCDQGQQNDDQTPGRCREDCSLPSCGDGVADTEAPYNEVCDEGAQNGPAPDAPCRADCTPRRCGDEILDPGAGEECDFGAAVVLGCDQQTCKAAQGWACDAVSCWPVCGDGAIHAWESCDDGNDVSGDGCSSICVIEIGFSCEEMPSLCVETCGDGRVVGNEQCDDGGRQDGDGCSSLCLTEPGYDCALAAGQTECRPVCGDGLVLGGEQCDDLNEDTGDGCNALCEVEPGWTCEGAPSACRRCGNGLLEPGETCDDGNAAAGDGCSASCELEAGWVCTGQPSSCSLTCGDGLLDAGEQCDDGDIESGDGCSASCREEAGFTCDAAEPSNCQALCGDALVRGLEGCDDGALDDDDGCSASCAIEPGWTCQGEPSTCWRCGDGLIEGLEACDDGNLDDEDGCTSACEVQSAWFCVTDSEPSVCTFPCGDYYGNLADGEVLEDCDDGNLVDGDGCSSTCLIEDGFVCENPDPAAMDVSQCAPVCGDGFVNQWEILPEADREACDDGALDDGDGCSSTCEIEPGWACPVVDDTSVCSAVCGDAEVVGLETCDDGNTADGDGCSASCVQEAGWMCSDGADGSVCVPNCGDGLVTDAEGCDTGTFVEGDGCSDSCTVEDGYRCSGEPSVCVLVACGDGVLDEGEDCDDGNTVDGDGCSATCTTDAACGNAVVGEGSETCDDGTQCSDGTACDGASACAGVGDEECRTRSSDGCSAQCTVEDGYTCTPEVPEGETAPGPSNCEPVCGDGLLRPGEECDDGNLVGDDGCSSFCTVEPGYTCDGASPTSCDPICGDGLRTGYEECDDANVESGDGCSAFCTVEDGFTCTGDAPSVCSGVCGDGTRSFDEGCDDGNTTGGDGCSTECVVEDGYTCPLAGQECQQCGNGEQEGTEECDDGNLVLRDGCSDLCQIEDEYCGDGVVQASFEDCDEGTANSDTEPDACRTDCTAPTCGDGVIDADEDCDLGDMNGTLSCSETCTVSCGDGILDPGQECDDGNQIAGDGCDLSCDVEPGFDCTGEPSVCRCDEATCPLPTGFELVAPDAVASIGCSSATASVELDTLYPAPVEDLVCAVTPLVGPTTFDNDVTEGWTLAGGGMGSIRAWPSGFMGCDREGRFFNLSGHPAGVRLEKAGIDLSGLGPVVLEAVVAFQSMPMTAADLAIRASCGSPPGPGAEVAAVPSAGSGGSDLCQAVSVDLSPLGTCADLRLAFVWEGGSGTAAAIDDITLVGTTSSASLTRPEATRYELDAFGCPGSITEIGCTWDDGQSAPVSSTMPLPWVDAALCGDGELSSSTEACDDGEHCEDGTPCTTDADCSSIGDATCRTRSGDGCSEFCELEP